MKMTVKDFEKIFKESEELESKFHHILRALDAIAADYRFVRLSHDKFLPAAKDYREYIKHSNERSSTDFKSVRGRLGAYSREMYKGQKETFGLLVHLWSAGFIKKEDHAVDYLFDLFKKAERKRLSVARAKVRM